jgi:flagellar basal-body rod protein FlgC
MDFFTALHVSASGLAAERTRVNVATSNLANAESTRGPDGKPYRRQDPVFEAVRLEAMLAGGPADGRPSPLQLATGQRPGTTGHETMGVRVSSVIEDQTPGRQVYSPGHPDADPQGFVTLPNVNPIHEVVNLMSASRGYEANATALETLKSMAQRAIDIAR